MSHILVGHPEYKCSALMLDHGSCKMSVFIYTDGRYYEPIYLVSNEKGKIKVKRHFFPEDGESIKFLNMSINNCVSKHLISWDKIRANTLKSEYFEVKPDIKAMELLDKVKSDIKIKAQYKDSFNKSIGFITEQGFLLPFKPRGEISDIPLENWKPQRLTKTIRFYNEMAKKYKLPYYPTRVFKDANGLIIAILLENNRIIQVVPEKTSVDLIEESSRFPYEEVHMSHSDK